MCCVQVCVYKESVGKVVPEKRYRYRNGETYIDMLYRKYNKSEEKKTDCIESLRENIQSRLRKEGGGGETKTQHCRQVCV